MSVHKDLIDLGNDSFTHYGEVFSFLQKIEDGSIDVLITDPPYPLGGELNLNFCGSTKYSDGEHYKQLSEFDLDLFIKKAHSKMKENSALFVMTNRSNRSFFEKSIRDAGFTIKNELIWVKLQGFDEGFAMGANYLNAVEYIIYAHKGVLGKVNSKMNVFVKNSPNRGRNSKPEELYAHILEPMNRLFEYPLVVDPFGGSDPLSRAKMRGLIHSMKTISNILITGDETDPAEHGKLLKSQNLSKWIN